MTNNEWEDTNNQKVTDREKIVNLIRRVGNTYEKLEENDEKKQKLSDFLIYLNEIIEIMDEFGPETTIGKAREIKEKRDKEKQESKDGRPKVRIFKNPNAPSLLPEDNDFFLGFIFTALTCSLLLGAYINILF